MNKCIICESESNLNTELNIKLDDNKRVTVYLCDEHEDTSPKKAKQHYLDRLSKLEEFYKQAKEMGIEVIESDGKMALVKPSSDRCPQHEPQPAKDLPETSPHAQHVQQVISKANDMEVNRVASEMNRAIPSVKSVTGRAEGNLPIHMGTESNMESRNSLNIQEMVEKAAGGSLSQKPMTSKVEMQETIGRGGQPMTIPSKIVGNVGETEIRVIKTDDAAIQTHAKNLEALSRTDDPHDFARGGYDAKECRACDGTGISKITKGVCVKCRGSGMIS